MISGTCTRYATLQIAMLTIALGLNRSASGADTSSHLFTASDFSAFGRDRPSDFRTCDDQRVDSWESGFEQKTEGNTVTLTSQVDGSDLKPGIRTIGKIEVIAGKPVRFLIEAPTGSGVARKAQDANAKLPPAPVPTLLFVSSISTWDGKAPLDLIRGRIDTVEPSPDVRRPT